MGHETEWAEGREFHLFHEDDEMHERCYWRRVGAILFFALALAMILVPLYVQAAPVFRNMGNDGQPVALRLLGTPCVSEKVLQHLKQEWHASFKAAELTYGGRKWESCWIEIDLTDQQGRPFKSVFSVDEEGAPLNPPYGIPKQLFREDTI